MRRDKPSARKWRSAGAEHYSVQDGHYKLILYLSDDDERNELYDLLEDPMEERDLSQIESVIHDRLLGSLRSWLNHAPASDSNQEIPEEKLEALKALGYLD